MTIEELQDQIKIENGYRKVNETTNTASDYANDYDWDSEWEAFNPIEACEDAFLAGIAYALGKLK